MTSGSTRRIFQEGLLFGSFGTNNANPDDTAFLEIARGSLFVDFNDTGTGLDFANIALAQSARPRFVLQGEAFEADEVQLTSFSYDLTLDAALASPVVPLPASFGLLALGLGAAGLVARRRKAAA